MFVLLAALALPSSAGARRFEHRVTQLASVTPVGTADTGVCQSEHHNICPKLVVTADGRRVFYTLGHQGPLYEHYAGRTRPVSVGPLGIGSISGNCYRFNLPSLCNYEVSEDGHTVAFSTGDSLVPGDTGGWDVYVRSGGVTRLVSTDEPEDEYGSLSALVEAISADGSRVFYRRAGYAESSPLYEWTGTGVSEFPADQAHVYTAGASRDGRRVFFDTSTPLVPEDANSLVDVYERTTQGRIELISADASGHAGGAYFNTASADGQRAIFTSDAPLTPDDADDETDVYMRERGIVTLLTSGTSSALVPPGSDHGPWRGVYFLAASADAKTVLFESDEPLVPEDTDGGAIDVYARADGETRLISTSSARPDSGYDNRFAYPNGTSADAEHVFFFSDDPLTPGDADSCNRHIGGPLGCTDIYERVRDTTRLVSTGPAATNGNYDAGSFFGVSTDGTRAFFSTTEPLVATDRDTCTGNGFLPPGCEDIYERHNGTTTLISTGATDDHGECGVGDTRPKCPGFIGMSADGTQVYFRTATSLTGEDVDGLDDIYVSSVVSGHAARKHHEQHRRKHQHAH
jgi:hypothetical protein